MTVSLVPEVIDALVDLMRGVEGYKDPDSTGLGVPVFDGPNLGLSGDHGVYWLGIGSALDPSTPGTAATIRQETVTTGRVRRDEAAGISCIAGAQSGDVEAVTMSELRIGAMGIVSDVEELTRSNPTLGIESPRLVVEVSSVDRLDQWVSRGLCVTVAFTISYRGRI